MNNRVEVREFLTSRRAKVTPQHAGIPAAGRRRGPGLRRSEVAALAGLSLAHYGKLERGSLTGLSARVLDAIARALHLDDAERAYLNCLAQQANGSGALLRPRHRTIRWSLQRSRDESGAFPRTRHAKIISVAAGIPESATAKLVSAPPREEAAALAATSTDNRIRLEQGSIQPSQPILKHGARVPQPAGDERDLVPVPAGKQPYVPPRGHARQKVNPQAQRLLDQLATMPALVIGHRTDVLAWNPMGAALLTDFGKIPEQERVLLRLLFVDPALRKLYGDWEQVARLAIAQVRRDSARHPSDAGLAALVNELSVRDAQFRQWWAAPDVALRVTGLNHLRHPIVGDLYLDWNTVTCADPGQSIIVWTAVPQSPTHDGLRMLASWAASPSLTSKENAT